MKIFLPIILALTFFGSAQAQEPKFSANPDEFIDYVAGVFSNNANSSEESEYLAEHFTTVWKNNLTPAQRSKTLVLTKQMLDKKYRVLPTFEAFFGTITYAIENESDGASKVNDFLDVTEKIVKNNNAKEALTYFTATTRFLQNRSLYFKKALRWYALEGTFSFEYGDAFEEEVVYDDAGFEEEKPEDDGWGSTPLSDDDGWGEVSSSNDDWEGWETVDETVQEDEVESQSFFYEPELPIIDLSGPYIQFANTNLTLVTRYDSVAVTKAIGAFLPLQRRFGGESGSFEWSQRETDEAISCDLSIYLINIERPAIKAEKTTLNYTAKLYEPIVGMFEFQSRRKYSPDKAPFPSFRSYRADIKVKSFSNDAKLVYKGGFSLRNRAIQSASIVPSESFLEYQVNGGANFRAYSTKFNLADSVVTSPLAEVSVYTQSDSIYHPAIQFKYNINSQELTLIKDDGIFKNAPFFASYYNVDINADLLKWNFNADSIDISILTGRNRVPALFESSEYFSKDKLNELSGVFNFNPLLLVVNAAKKSGSDKIYAYDLATASRQTPQKINAALNTLKGGGYVDYDDVSGEVNVKPKAYHYVLSLNKAKDYDDILIPSVSPAAPNATIDLKTQALTVRGIERFFVSKTKGVFIEPSGSQITLLENRDFQFDGFLYAGNFEFIGKEFTFKYDSFLIDMQNIDSIRFYVRQQGRDFDPNQRVNNKIQFVSPDDPSATFVKNKGKVFIDRTNNKSSRKSFPEYPRFQATNGGIVYFDGGLILDGAYDRSVFFLIPPFDVDSLSNADIAAISFEGMFHSGGIFAPIKEVLHVMPDFSLGFEHRVPAEGYQLYDGEGRYFNDFTLDNKGIRGDGRIEYLSSTQTSDDFIFYQDSVTTEVGQDYLVKEGDYNGVSYPNLKISGYSLNWTPKSDSMIIVNNDSSTFNLYGDYLTLKGQTLYSAKGVFGQGQGFTPSSRLKSDDYYFKQYEFGSRNTLFAIESDNKRRPSLAAQNVKVDFDLSNRKVSFQPETIGDDALIFPNNRLKSSIHSGTWDILNKKIFLEKPEDIDISQSYVYATKKSLDSLAFNADYAEYDINTKEVLFKGIPDIKVADARLIPDRNETVIYEGGKLNRFENSTVYVDTLNSYHTLFNASIDIESRNAFQGIATYRYINGQKDTLSINLTRFDLVPDEDEDSDKLYNTVSTGVVNDYDNFTISPGMIFKGKATMFANKSALELDGFVKLDIYSTNSPDYWIQYFSNDPSRQEIVFDFATATTESGITPIAGLQYDLNKDEIYSTFLTEKRNPDDFDFFTPDGLVYFDEKNNIYKVEDTLKAAGQSFSGKNFTYDPKELKVTFEGPVNFIQNLQKFQINASAKGKGDVVQGEVELNAFMTVNFDIPAQALSTMGRDFAREAEDLGLPEANRDFDDLLFKLGDLVGNKATKRFEEDNVGEYTSLTAVGSQLLKTLVLSDIDMKWSNNGNSWYSDGNVGLSNVGNTNVNARLESYVELRKTEQGDIFSAFFKTSPENWYYFKFEENTLITVSSNSTYNDIVGQKTNIDKAKFGEYIYNVGERSEVLDFVTTFRTIYLGYEEPYAFETPADIKGAKPATITPLFGSDVTQEETTTEDDEDDGF